MEFSVNNKIDLINTLGKDTMNTYFRKRAAILLVAMGISSADALHAESTNYCHDEEVNQQWEELAQRNSYSEIKELYVLRKELCQQVDEGTITLDSAIDKFESEREKKIKALKERRDKIEQESQRSVMG